MAKRGGVQVVEEKERKCGTRERVVAILALAFWNATFCFAVYLTHSEIQDLHQKNDTNHLRL